MLYDDYANPREPVTAARARTRSRSGLNGRPQDEGIVGDPGARVPRRQRCTLRLLHGYLRLLRPTRSPRIPRRIRKKGIRRAHEATGWEEGEQGGGRDRCPLKRHSREMWETDDPLSLSMRAADPFVLDTMTSPRSFFTCHQGYTFYTDMAGRWEEHKQ